MHWPILKKGEAVLSLLYIHILCSYLLRLLRLFNYPLKTQYRPTSLHFEKQLVQKRRSECSGSNRCDSHALQSQSREALNLDSKEAQGQGRGQSSNGLQ